LSDLSLPVVGMGVRSGRMSAPSGPAGFAPVARRSRPRRAATGARRVNSSGVQPYIYKLAR